MLLTFFGLFLILMWPQEVDPIFSKSITIFHTRMNLTLLHTTSSTQHLCLPIETNMEKLDRRSIAYFGTSSGPESHESTAKTNSLIEKAKPLFELSDGEESSPVRRESLVSSGSPTRTNKKKIREAYGLQLQSGVSVSSSFTPYGVEEILSVAAKSPRKVTATGSAISAVQAMNESRSSPRTEARPNTSPFAKVWDFSNFTPEIADVQDLKTKAESKGTADSEETHVHFESDSLERPQSITRNRLKCLRTEPSSPTRGVAHTNKYRLKKVEDALTDAAERKKILDELHDAKAIQRQEEQNLRFLAQKKRRKLAEQERQRKQKEHIVEMKVKEHEKNEISKKSQRPVTTIKTSRSGGNDSRTISLQDLGMEDIFKCDDSTSPQIDRIKSL